MQVKRQHVEANLLAKLAHRRFVSKLAPTERITPVGRIQKNPLHSNPQAAIVILHASVQNGMVQNQLDTFFVG